jgi:very-short-patch-repair endonuclease
MVDVKFDLLYLHRKTVTQYAIEQSITEDEAIDQLLSTINLKIKKPVKDKNWVTLVTGSEERLSVFLQRKGLEVVCGKQLHGYYPDIRIKDSMLLIEVDGGYHKAKAQKRKDREQTQHLTDRGYTVLRFTNEQVKKDRNLIFKKIKAKLDSMPKNNLEIKPQGLEPGQNRGLAKDPELCKAPRVGKRKSVLSNW